MATENQSWQGQPLPQNLDAEKNFLGNLILDGSLFDNQLNQANLSPRTEDFASSKHRLIYSVMLTRAQSSDKRNLDSQQLDNSDIFAIPLLIADLERLQKLDQAGGRSYLVSLTDSLGSKFEIVEYAKVIIDLAKRRRLIKFAQATAQLGYNPDDKTVNEIFNESSAALNKLIQEDAYQDNGPQNMVEISLELFRSLKDQLNAQTDTLVGLPTGYHELDMLLSGLRKQALYIIAARPGVGKTSFAMNIVENIVTNDQVKKPALVFSLEMPNEQIAMRMLSTFGAVKTENLRRNDVSPQVWKDILAQIKKLTYVDENGQTHSKFYIDDSGSLTPLELRLRALNIANAHGGLSLIMVDYIQLMHSHNKKENRSVEVGEISRSLKALSKELDVPIIALSQLNRDVESRKDSRPMNSDLRESGSLEQDADVILFIDRDVNKGKSSVQQDDSMASRATIIVGKNRHGAVKDVELGFVGAYTTFVDSQQAHTLEPPIPQNPPLYQ